MMKNFFRQAVSFLLVVVCALMIAVPAFPEENSLSQKDMANYKKVLEWASSTQPSWLDLGDTNFTLAQLVKIKDAMPEGSAFTWTAHLGKLAISSADTVVDLDSGAGQVTAETIRQLLRLLPQVEEIDAFKHTNLSNADMTALVDANPSVKFGWCIHIKDCYPLRSDATAFSTMKKSRNNRLRDKDVEVLKYVPGLKAIDLGHNLISDLSFLLNFPELRILIIADNSVTDISPLHELKELEYLEIFHNEITDLSPLTGLDNLLDLNVCGNRLSDISPVEQLPALERFWCINTKVSEESQRQFNAARPDVLTCWMSVRGSGYYTSDGWRTHWRYKQYVPMFKNREYTPFQKPEEE